MFYGNRFDLWERLSDLEAHLWVWEKIFVYITKRTIFYCVRKGHIFTKELIIRCLFVLNIHTICGYTITYICGLMEFCGSVQLFLTTYRFSLLLSFAVMVPLFFPIHKTNGVAVQIHILHLYRVIHYNYTGWFPYNLIIDIAEQNLNNIRTHIRVQTPMDDSLVHIIKKIVCFNLSILNTYWDTGCS